MKLNNRDEQLICHIARYCDEIEYALTQFHRDKSLFLSDPIFFNACCMPLMQIGELAKRLSNELLINNQDIPWKQIKGMRDFFAHDYLSMDKEIIWNTILKGIPSLSMKCQCILRENSSK